MGAVLIAVAESPLGSQYGVVIGSLGIMRSVVVKSNDGTSKASFEED